MCCSVIEVLRRIIIMKKLYNDPLCKGDIANPVHQAMKSFYMQYYLMLWMSHAACGILVLSLTDNLF